MTFATKNNSQPASQNESSYADQGDHVSTIPRSDDWDSLSINWDDLSANWDSVFPDSSVGNGSEFADKTDPNYAPAANSEWYNQNNSDWRN